MPKMAKGAPASGANLNMFVNGANGVPFGLRMQEWGAMAQAKEHPQFNELSAEG